MAQILLTENGGVHIETVLSTFKGLSTDKSAEVRKSCLESVSDLLNGFSL